MSDSSKKHQHRHEWFRELGKDIDKFTLLPTCSKQAFIELLCVFYHAGYGIDDTMNVLKKIWPCPALLTDREMRNLCNLQAELGGLLGENLNDAQTL